VRILIACEFSGVVREAFNSIHGCHAVSCDILPCEDGRVDYHRQCDVLDILGEGWDLMIAHPPCTHLAVSGAAFFAEKRKDGRQQDAIGFFMELVNAPIPRICVENPVCIMSTTYRKPDQIIQPWQFGHETTKTTCLWLKNLPKLVPTNIVGKGERQFYASGKSSPAWHAKTGGGSGHKRSVTFSGIARAMADQWGNL